MEQLRDTAGATTTRDSISVLNAFQKKVLSSTPD